MYEIEAIDRYKKSISRKVIGGYLFDFYSSFTIISSCEQQWITWTFEYEKKLEDNQEPINFLGFILNVTKDIEGHFLKKKKKYILLYMFVCLCT
uniref:Bet v I/Major latex protein domain-containing protein n=1 Tax=Solanum lycopersicum TaxID=4081 RepID=A0A3Q7EAK0_SOLLC